MFVESHEIDEVTQLCSLRSSAFRVGRNFGETLRNFTNFWQHFAFRISRNRKTCTLRNYVILVIWCFASNIISIEEKKSSTDSFVSDDPRVYEPVCYEMLVGKEYYTRVWGRTWHKLLDLFQDSRVWGRKKNYSIFFRTLDCMRLVTTYYFRTLDSQTT